MMKKIFDDSITDTQEIILIACFVIAIPIMIDAVQRVAQLVEMIK